MSNNSLKRKRNTVDYREDDDNILEDSKNKQREKKVKRDNGDISEHKKERTKPVKKKKNNKKEEVAPNENKIETKQKVKSKKSLNKEDVIEDTTTMKGKVVMSIKGMVRAVVVNRPSKVVKSPYMADIIVEGSTEEVLCHSPALGCAGLIVQGSNVLVTPKDSASAKSKYSLDLVDIGSSIVGANPNFCNKMVKTALERGFVDGLPQFDKKNIKSEASIDESRFDFKCVQDSITYYVEVKGVPNACISDVKMSPMKKSKIQQEVNDARDKIAYFPDGYRKKADEAISPRALKHVQHLTRLCKEPDTVCVLLFVVQRQDCIKFQPTKNDPLYRKAVYEASAEGVKVLAHCVSWTEDGTAVWGKLLPLNLKDESDEF